MKGRTSKQHVTCNRRISVHCRQEGVAIIECQQMGAWTPPLSLNCVKKHTVSKRLSCKQSITVVKRWAQIAMNSSLLDSNGCNEHSYVHNEIGHFLTVNEGFKRLNTHRKAGYNKAVCKINYAHCTYWTKVRRNFLLPATFMLLDCFGILPKTTLMLHSVSQKKK